jgi:ubiquitin-protein ligase E3 C
VDIRREYMLDDAFENIWNKNFDMKKHLKIRFIDEQHQVEDGLDGGGLLKEFMTKLTAEIFDINRCYF